MNKFEKFIARVCWDLKWFGSYEYEYNGNYSSKTFEQYCQNVQKHSILHLPDLAHIIYSCYKPLLWILSIVTLICGLFLLQLPTIFVIGTIFGFYIRSKSKKILRVSNSIKKSFDAIKNEDK